MASHEHKITSVSQLCDLWKGVYRGKHGVDWSGLLPYYDEDIRFKDSIQEIRGMADFVAMTERLARRSRDLNYVIHCATMDGNLVFVEWEMVISYKKYPTSSVYGTSRITLREGKIVEQQGYRLEVLYKTRLKSEGGMNFLRELKKMRSLTSAGQMRLSTLRIKGSSFSISFIPVSSALRRFRLWRRRPSAPRPEYTASSEH